MRGWIASPFQAGGTSIRLLWEDGKGADLVVLVVAPDKDVATELDSTGLFDGVVLRRELASSAEREGEERTRTTATWALPTVISLIAIGSTSCVLSFPARQRQ